MEIVIVSDNHGRKEILEKIRHAYPNADAYIHCGDSEMDEYDLKPYLSVMGNNDWNYFPEYRVVGVGDKRVLVIHSHTLPYGNTVKNLVKLAKKESCDIACYGHTHRYDDQIYEGIQVVNPGSLFYNRDGSKPSYAILREVDGIITVKRKFAEDL